MEKTLVAALVMLPFLAVSACSLPGESGSAFVPPEGTFSAEPPPASEPLISSRAPTPPPLPTMPPEISWETHIYDVIARDYQGAGISLTRQDWDGLQAYICDDLAAGGRGEWTTTEQAQTLPDYAQQELARSALVAATLSECSTLTPPGTGLESAHTSLLTSLYYAEQFAQLDRIEQYNDALLEYQRTYEVDVSALLQAPSSVSGGSSGYTVRCEDGTTSYSGGEQGACSHHGGVDD